MEEHIKIGILLQIYGELLTEKQRNAMNDYYNEDLSLAEIAENQGISRQGVRALIEQGKEKMLEFERALGLMKKSEADAKSFEKIDGDLDEILKLNPKNKAAEEAVSKIKNEIRKIRNGI